MPKPLTLVINLVGAHFRPPAKALLAVLPTGAELTLVPEPENPYDPSAIAVWVDLQAELPTTHLDELADALAGTGWDVDSVMGQSQWQLGYLPKSGGKPAAGGPGNCEATAMLDELPSLGLEAQATLGWSIEGTPVVMLGAKGRSPARGGER